MPHLKRIEIYSGELSFFKGNIIETINSLTSIRESVPEEYQPFMIIEVYPIFNEHSLRSSSLDIKVYYERPEADFEKNEREHIRQVSKKINKLFKRRLKWKKKYA